MKPAAPVTRTFSICHSYHLVSFKQVACIDLVRHVRELVAPAVGDDHVAAGLEGLRSWVTSEPKNSDASSVGS